MRMREEGLNLEDLRARGLLSIGPGRPLKSLSSIFVFLNVPLTAETGGVSWVQERSQRARVIVKDKDDYRPYQEWNGRKEVETRAALEAELNTFGDCLNVDDEGDGKYQHTPYSCASCALTNLRVPLPLHLRENLLRKLCNMAELKSPMMKDCPSLDPGQMGNCECKVGGELGPMMEGVGVGSSTEGK